MKVRILLFALVLIIFSSGKVNAADVAKIIFVPDGKLVAGKNLKVNIFVESNAPVNAVQLTATFPTDQFTYGSIDTTKSKFSIKAEERVINGGVILARGNINPLSGRNLLAVMTLVPTRASSSIKQISYSVSDSLVMSTNNVNILSGSQVLTLKPQIEPTTQTTEAEGNIIIKVIKEFINKLFGK